MSKHQFSQITLLERILHLISFGVISYGTISLLTYPSASSDNSVTTLHYAVLVGYFLLLISIALVWNGAGSRWLVNTLRAITGLVLVILTFLLVGFMQDVFGAQCTGFFGATVSCIDNSLFLFRVLMGAPFLFLPIVIILELLLCWGIKSTLDKNNSWSE